MTDDMREFGLGAIPSPPDPGDEAYHFARIAAEIPMPTLPVTVPLPPGGAWDQLNEGTCVGHGVGLAAVVAIHKATGQWIISNAIAGHALGRDPYHQANPIDLTYQAGTYVRSGLKAAQKVGVLGADGKRYRIGTYRSLLPSADILGDVERAIGAGMIVVAGARWPRAWMARDYAFDTLPEPGANPIIAGGHCFAIWRVASKHPAAGVPSLRTDPSIMNSWDHRWTQDGAAYFDGALLSGPLYYDLWVVEA